MVQQAVSPGQIGVIECCVPARGSARKSCVEGQPRQEGTFDSLFRKGLPDAERPEGPADSRAEEPGCRQTGAIRDPKDQEEEKQYEAAAIGGVAAQLPPTMQQSPEALAEETGSAVQLFSQASMDTVSQTALLSTGPEDSAPAPAAQNLVPGQMTRDGFPEQPLPISGQAGLTETAEGTATPQPVVQAQDGVAVDLLQGAEDMADNPDEVSAQGEQTSISQESRADAGSLTAGQPETGTRPVPPRSAEGRQDASQLPPRQRQDQSLDPSAEGAVEQAPSLPVQEIPADGKQTGGLLADPDKDSSGPAVKETEPRERAETPVGSVLDGISAALTQRMQTQEESPVYSAAVSKAFNRFVESFRGAEANPSQIRIVLEPEELGSLVITVSSAEGKIAARIQSEDKKVCAAISRQLQELISALESKGVSVQDVDVVYGGIQQSLDFDLGGFGARQEQSLPNRSFGRPQSERAAAPGFFEMWQAPAAPDRDTTVEYRI